jgi:hypothetical protein
MEEFEEKSGKKIYFALGIFFLVLMGLSFFLWKRNQERSKKVEEALKEKEKIEQQIKEKEKELKKIDEKIIEILTQTKAFEDGEVPGVKIEKRGEKKLVKNEDWGYSLEIPEKMILAQSITSDELKFFVPDQGGEICCPGWRGCPPDLIISVENNEENLDLEKWVEINRGKEIASPEDGIYLKKLGWQKVGNYQWYKLDIFIEGVFSVPTFEYFLSKDQKIYSVSITQWTDPFNRDCTQKIPYSEVEKVLESFQIF